MNLNVPTASVKVTSQDRSVLINGKPRLMRIVNVSVLVAADAAGREGTEATPSTTVTWAGYDRNVAEMAEALPHPSFCRLIR